MIKLKPLALVLFVALGASFAQAQEKAGDTKVAPATQAAELADGEVRKIDKDNKKITLKHGEIKNLDMPGMTMVFKVKDPVMLDKVKVGDKIKFAAEMSGGAIVVTEIQSRK